MGRHDTEQLPADVVRDLLGIARAVYAKRNAERASVDELATLEKAGKAFVLALELSRTLPDTLGHRAAWSWAEQGIAHLSTALEDRDDSAAELVVAWGERLRGAG